MTKEIKTILRKDLKKYQSLAKYANEEDKEKYFEIANCIEKILKE